MVLLACSHVAGVGSVACVCVSVRSLEAYVGPRFVNACSALSIATITFVQQRSNVSGKISFDTLHPTGAPIKARNLWKRRKAARGRTTKILAFAERLDTAMTALDDIEAPLDVWVWIAPWKRYKFSISPWSHHVLEYQQPASDRLSHRIRTALRRCFTNSSSGLLR